MTRGIAAEQLPQLTVGLGELGGRAVSISRRLACRRAWGTVAELDLLRGTPGPPPRRDRPPALFDRLVGEERVGLALQGGEGDLAKGDPGPSEACERRGPPAVRPSPGKQVRA